jgi:hypothetical protein
MNKLFTLLLIGIINICIYPIPSNAGFLRDMIILGEIDRTKCKFYSRSITICIFIFCDNSTCDNE